MLCTVRGAPLAMDCTSLNQYEEQLYSVFKTFDVDNSEALNKAAVLALCDALQLEERGAALADSLFERRTQRVTFAQFRSGLLAVLGDPAPAPGAAPAPAAAPHPPHSDDDSSGREVAPKFVVGSKKYGRRSRPQRAASAPDDVPAAPPGPDRRMRCKRSASAMDARDAASPSPAPPDLDHDSRIDCERALSLCRHLRMDGIDRRLVERIFEAAPSVEITVGEFFDRLNSSLTTSIAGSNEAAAVAGPDDDVDDDDDDEATGGALPAELVVEAWERAGVQRPRRLLAELGFEGAALRAPALERALDDELRALAEPADARGLLLLAALALSRLRRRRARRCAVDAAAERDRLRADVAESNRRARLLAQEVDENHARLEAELTASLRRTEARHAEQARAAEAERGAERERVAAERRALEAEVSRRAEGEARLRADAAALRQRALELEARAAAAEGRAAGAERERARLAAALRRAQEEAGAAPAGGEAAGALAARVVELRGENTRLRDRCDELCAALELSARAGGAGAGAGEGQGQGASWREEAGVAEPAAPPHGYTEQECDSLPASLPRRESDPVTSVSRADGGTQTDRVRVADCVAQAGGGGLAEEGDDTLKHSELVKELETSLEQMKVEYERCEEYWSGKLEEERELFAEEQRASDERLAELVDKIGEYERQFARALPPIDERCALEQQVTALEDEFQLYRRQKEAELGAAADRLRAQDLRLKQIMDSETSPTPASPQRPASPPPGAPTSSPPGAPAVQRPARVDTTRCAQCAALGARLAELQGRLGRVAGAHAVEAGALRGRLARADAHAARLTARLHAADLLVKDLYVENCLLGPAPRRL